METLKSFIKDNFSISYAFVYGNNLSKIFNRAFNNYKKNKSFKCNENKILKIISLGIYYPNDIEKLCKYLSDTDFDTDLNEIKEIHINIKTDTNFLRQEIKEHLKKIKNYRNKIKDKNKFSVIYFLLNMLFINLDNINNINALLKDNEINTKKIKVFDKDELRYISKKPFLLGLIKKIPLKTLKIIKNKIKEGEEQ